MANTGSENPGQEDSGYKTGFKRIYGRYPVTKAFPIYSHKVQHTEMSLKLSQFKDDFAYFYRNHAVEKDINDVAI